MMWDGWGWGFGMLWMLLMLLFWIGVVLLIVWAVRQFTGDRRDSTGSRDRALEVLEERFARGEIDHDEFEERRRTLRGR
jgi:putative membrane protein